MGLFSFFKRWKPVIIQDEVFGELRFSRSSDPSKRSFWGSVFFAPANKEINFQVFADETGPTEAQYDFYKTFCENFDLYAAKLKPFIEREFREWKADFEIKNFKEEFILDWMVIPRQENKPLRWEMTFTSPHVKNHDVIIWFIDDEPAEMAVDG